MQYTERRIKTYPNQESFTIDKKINKSANKGAEVEKDALGEAMKHLTPSELIIWLYIMSNKDDVEGAFSTQDCMNKTGLCEKSIRNAKKGLKQKGYWDADGKIFHQYSTNKDGIIYPFLEETISTDPCKDYRRNKINTNNINNMGTLNTFGVESTLEHPEEEEKTFIF